MIIYVVLIIVSFVLSLIAIILKSKNCPNNECVCPNSIFGNISPNTIIMWGQNFIPSGWVICDGTNNTPDLRGKFVLGQNDGNPNKFGNVAQDMKEILSIRNINDTGGEEKHLLTVDELASHTHTISNVTPSGKVYSYSGGSNLFSDPNKNPIATSTGGDMPHNNMPPYYVLIYIMKT